ncbi:MAG: hypothetical protein QXL94_06865 [Candidatus Parvarchaeum sp.]
MTDLTPNPATPNEVNATKTLLGAFFPALLFGLAGMIAFGTFGALFGMINSSATTTIPSFFANFSTMAFLGFTIGFGGYLGYIFDSVILKSK